MLAFCCVDMYGILFVMYSNSVFAITERSEMVLYDVHIRMHQFRIGIVLMFCFYHILLL